MQSDNHSTENKITRSGNQVVVVVVVRRTGPVQVLLTSAVYLPIKLTVHFGVAHGGAKAWSSFSPIPEIQKGFKIQDMICSLPSSTGNGRVGSLEPLCETNRECEKIGTELIGALCQR